MGIRGIDSPPISKPHCGVSDLPKKIDDPWKTPEILAFRAAAKACFLAGTSYRELKDVLATEDELTPISERMCDPLDPWDNRPKLPPALHSFAFASRRLY